MRDPVVKPPLVWPVRPRNLIWLPVLGAGVLAAMVFGTPHLRFRYVWNGKADAPLYYSCDYVGLHPFNLQPADGECAVLMLSRGSSGNRHE